MQALAWPGRPRSARAAATSTSAVVRADPTPICTASSCQLNERWSAFHRFAATIVDVFARKSTAPTLLGLAFFAVISRSTLARNQPPDAINPGPHLAAYAA